MIRHASVMAQLAGKLVYQPQNILTRSTGIPTKALHCGAVAFFLKIKIDVIIAYNIHISCILLVLMPTLKSC